MKASRIEPVNDPQAICAFTASPAAISDAVSALRCVHPVKHSAMQIRGPVPSFRATFRFIIGIALLFVLPCAGLAAERRVLHGHVPPAVARLVPLGRFDGANRLNLALGLPLRNQAALAGLLHDLYDPASPKFRNYLTPAQFAEQFGPTEQDYQALIGFVQANGLKVTATHPNRVILDVEGATADIERTFHVVLRTYQHPGEARVFRAPDVEPSHDAPVALLSVSGLDDYSIPHPNMKLKPGAAILQQGISPAATPNSGSAPGGAYAAGDFRAAYVPGTALTGTGQSVGLLQFDGYYSSDIAAYRTRFGLANVTLVNVPVDGGVSTPGSGNGEVCLDIEMVMSMAPGVSTIYVYEAPNPSPWVDLLSRMANDNLAKQLSCSWGGGSPDAAAEAIFQQMAAQGQSFFNASGDSDAFTGSVPFPSESPNITQVGGTTLTTSGAGGSYVSETVWNWGNGTGSSGGISTTYSIPAWQQGISMATNQGSTTNRNIPDVALTGDNVFVTYNNGGTGTFGGTSCAAPLWAGFMALVNQQAAANGQAPIGFVNPALYNIGKAAAYASNFHDTSTGNNFSSSSPTRFSAVAGYDLCTGWGTPVGTTLIATLTTPVVPAINTFAPAGGSAGTVVTITGTNFTGATNVAFNGISASFTVNSATQITATAPAGVASGPIKVTAPGGTSTSSTSFAVISFSPAFGVTGSNVTITGSGFTGASAVSFGGISASFTVNSSTQITATVPASASSGPINVTVPGGTYVSGNNFVVLTGNGKPTVTSFTPTSAAVGASVTISGTNFVNVTGVSFNGVSATFTVVSPTQITATVPVPAGSTTGPITVATGLGTGSSATTFTTLATLAVFNAASDVPVTASSFTATGTTVYFTLNFAPPTGTALTVVKNTGIGFINGTFGNLAQGQQVTLTYGGVTYKFIANYFGGSGNDLVLQWANTRPLAWGLGTSGQLGNNTTATSLSPASVTTGGVLSGKTVTGMAAGQNHTLAVCADGTAFAWGLGTSGQLGINSFANNSVPVAVVTSGVLSGKLVVAVAAGAFHSVALCSDGTIATWGANTYGQLGNGTSYASGVPVAVTTGGALSGKKVAAIAAGQHHCLALCSDGTLVAWGRNSSGQLGNGGTLDSNVPVAVTIAGTPLAGRAVIAIAAGYSHNLAACADGTLTAWGLNGNAQLGNGGYADSSVPTGVTTVGTPLAGRAISALAAGGYFSMALCADGTLAAWGNNGSGQLGDGSTVTQRAVAVAVRAAGTPLSGRNVSAISAGGFHAMALCSDGTLLAWGYNGGGQIGNGNSTDSNVPAAVNTSPLTAGERFTFAGSGPNAFHSLGMVASPLSPGAATLAATSITTSGATLNGSCNPNGYATTAQFQYGGSTSYGAITGGQAIGSGTSAVNVSATIAGLAAHTTYHFAASGSNAAGSGIGSDFTFTTLDNNPVANPDAAINISGPVTIAVLANDTDTDGDILTVTGVTQGLHGTVSTTGTSVTYVPGATFTSGDTFTYTISDGFGGTATGNVTVTAAPIMAWRAQQFGADAVTAAISGDTADPNANGIPNLLEYALHGDPIGSATGSNILPQAAVGADNTLQLAFTHWLDRTDITITVQSADSPAGPWISLVRSTGGSAFTGVATGAAFSEAGSGSSRAVIVKDLYQTNDPAHPLRVMRLQVTRP
jgi:alpha-tubulin suppressor-like RCC1 family protein